MTDSAAEQGSISWPADDFTAEIASGSVGSDITTWSLPCSSLIGIALWVSAIRRGTLVSTEVGTSSISNWRTAITSNSC